MTNKYSGSFAEAAVPDAEVHNSQERRRSSVWSIASSASGASKRLKLFGNVKNIFTRSPATTEGKEDGDI